MARIIFFFILLSTVTVTSFAQSFSLNDTTITFKDVSGKILTKEEVLELTKNTFSSKTETSADGKKIITIKPITEEEMAERANAVENFKKSLVNKQIQDFSFTDIKGNKFSKADLAGKIVVFNFWFIACKPCIMEMPHLNELVAEYKDKNVVFIAPALDETEPIKGFLEKRSFDYNIIASARDYTKGLGIRSFPTHLIVDANGVVKDIFIGYNDNIKTQVGGAIDKALNSSK